MVEPDSKCTQVGTSSLILCEMDLVWPFTKIMATIAKVKPIHEFKVVPSIVKVNAMLLKVSLMSHLDHGVTKEKGEISMRVV